jgi:hypothetical protein
LGNERLVLTNRPARIHRAGGKTGFAHCAIVGRREPPIRIGPLLLTMGLAGHARLSAQKRVFTNAAGKNKFS